MREYVPEIAALLGEHDPLIVVKFYEDEIQHHTEAATEAVDMRFMIAHDDFFGSKKVKKNPTALREMWLEVKGKIDEGN